MDFSSPDVVQYLGKKLSVKNQITPELHVPVLFSVLQQQVSSVLKESLSLQM